MELRQHLDRQLEVSWSLLRLHLAGLEDHEALWRPAEVGLHVLQDERQTWVAEWPEREDYSIGPPSIAWLTWHIGFWWSMVHDHSFGGASLQRESVTWPGSADAARAWLSRLHDDWVASVAGVPDDEFGSTSRTRWPMRDRPFVDVLAWVNVELMKNAAEIGYARFLYAARPK